MLKSWYKTWKYGSLMKACVSTRACAIRVCLTHWGRVTHTCVGKLTIIGSDNGLSPGRRQAIIRTNAGILLIGTLGTNFSEILSEIHTFSLKKVHLKMSSGRWRPFCLGLNVLIKYTMHIGFQLCIGIQELYAHWLSWLISISGRISVVFLHITGTQYGFQELHGKVDTSYW